MPGFRARVTAMTDALRSNPNVEVISVAIAPPAPQADLDAATELAGGALPAGTAGFYRELNGFQLEWRRSTSATSRSDLSDHGLINILPISDIFRDWRGVTWFGEDDDEFRAVKPFDMFVPEACAAFLQPVGEPAGASVAYHYFGEECYDTSYSFEEYLERLLASRGFWYWIQTLCPGLESSAEVTAFREIMPQIFPDYDDGLFRPR
jgi:hypothetical protein